MRKCGVYKMGILEIAGIVTAMVITVAFIINFLVEIWKFIYRIAPLVFPLMLIAFLLYISGNLNFPAKDMEGQNANNIESVKDQSGRSGHSK